MTRAGHIRVGIVIAFVLLVEALCRFGAVRPTQLVPPSVMAEELWALMGTTDFWAQLGTSARSIVIAFVAAMLAGCSIAVILHSLPRVRSALEPLIASYYALPFFVLYPLLIVLFGMNDTPIIVIGFLYAVMAVIVGTMSGLDRLPNVLRRTGRIHRLTRFQQAVHIQIPAAAPHIFTGAKLAMGYSITGVLGSEFILANSGYGYAISFAYNNFEDRKMYALLLFLIVAITLLTILLYRAQKSVQHRSGQAGREDETHHASVGARLLAGLAVAAALVLVWQLVHEDVGNEALASPLATFQHLGRLLDSPQFWGHMQETGTALGLALLISCLCGTLLGILLGIGPTASEVSEPLLVTLYSLPKVTLYPVVLLFVGVGLGAKVMFGAMYGLIPMTLIAMNAVRSMNPTLRRTAQVLRLSRAQTVTRIMLPATLPEIVTGIRVSFSITLLGVMIGEMFASVRGLGFMIMNGINVNDTATMMAVTIVVAVFAISVNIALIAWDRAVHRK